MSKPELSKRLLALMSNHPGESYNYKQLAMRLQVKSMDVKRQISEVLRELGEKGELEEISTGRYKMRQRGAYITGEVELTAKGSAYIISNESKEDVFVAFPNLKHALNGDKVKVLVYARSRDRRPEGEVVEILERKKGTFVGVVQRSANYAFLIPTGKQLPYDVFIPTEHLNGAENGDKVVVKIKDWPESQKNPVGEVIEVLGRPGDNDTEMNAIMAEYELPVKFPPNVLKAAEKIPLDIPEEEIRKRRDCRELTTFTIDPKDAKDFDDALSVRTLKEGVYEVGVHIADVSYYVKENTVLDKEAYARATSVYLVDRTIPMLPERLSNGVCSLRPDEDKLCFSAIFKLDANAQVLDQWFGRTVIRSNRRFTYEEAQERIEGAEGDYREEILLLNRLAQKLRQDRFKAGAIDFDRVEVKFNLDEKGHPVSVYFKRSKEANKLIEEFKKSMENEEGYQNIYIDSNVKLDTDDLFSLELILYQGAGSGYEQHKHYTVDKKTGKELSLKDLCGDDYIDTISEEIKTQMREQMAADETVQYWLDDPEVEEWNFDKIAEDQDFYVNEDGHIVVCFNEYDVAPGSMGCVEFTLNETVNVK